MSQQPKQTEQKPLFSNHAFGIFMAIALSVFFSTVFDELWIAIMLGVLGGLLLFGGLNRRQQ